ncbi:histidine phosphatase family protein [Planomicrobium sp. CPCC 101110]|uniref:histidine phosphatase family protein n=1 Tax=Planomicrobium sp. CPCC 101110 TaxID=2599619 RepID=UPI0011B6BA4D|nr:histidine phosphatase family protein [Planomicrobium sp. CPCC 101110]TWT27075.1 histidine phosphatase family protein [Planomicrobium sp. CPCC 101110]
MEISLIRHGKSQFIHKGRVTFKEFEEWAKNYDLHGISEEPVCPPETFQKITAANIVITSDLKRSVESAKLLNLKAGVLKDALFRETELPAGSMKLFNIKARPASWAILLRILWFGGYSNECESLKEAKQRAEKAAQHLIVYSREYRSVALVGHGFFNMLIAKELQRKGWKGKRKLGAKHWNCVSYVLRN